MNTLSFACMWIVGASCCVVPSVAVAFNSIPPWSRHGHVSITIEAARQMGWPKAAAEALAQANVMTDFVQMASPCPGRPWKPCAKGDLYNPASHFDRTPDDSNDHLAALRRGCEFLVQRREEIQQALDDGDCDLAITRLGQALHAVQDVASHSNIVDNINSDDHSAVEELYSELILIGEDRDHTGHTINQVHWIMITGSDAYTGRDTRLYGHDAHSKDAPSATDFPESMLPTRVGTVGLTKFDAAHSIAISFSKLYLARAGAGVLERSREILEAEIRREGGEHELARRQLEGYDHERSGPPQ